ncbi:MAG: hypothetical protein IJ343_03420 [Clostridia bacterium]|nr:hypothetical protein [Clostridia bacterium]
MMKQMICILLALLLTAPALAQEPVLTAEDFTLRLSDAPDAEAFAVGDPAEALLKALESFTGAPVVMTFEDQDCMLPGMTREYTTADELFVLATRPLPGDPQANTLESVMVLTPQVATARGARVGMTLEEITALYGDGYVLDYDTAFYGNGMLEPQLLFFFDTQTWTVTAWLMLRNMVI